VIDGDRMTDDETAATARAAAHPSGPDPPSPRRPGNPETRRLYALDWTAFELWCAAAGRISLPATAATVVAFLTEAAPGLSAGALARRASAIAARHRARGFAAPTVDRAVMAVLRTARRNAAPRRAAGPAPAQLMRLAGACGGDLAGVRDRALLLLLAAAGLGPAALVGLDVEHIRFTATAAEVTLESAGDWVGRLTVPGDADPSRCPVQALRDWLQISDTQFGPVFRKIDRWGTIEHRRFGVAAVRHIVRRRTPRRARRSRKAAAP
jgi:site-specific recombinase XerC